MTSTRLTVQAARRRLWAQDHHRLTAAFGLQVAAALAILAAATIVVRAITGA